MNPTLWIALLAIGLLATGTVWCLRSRTGFELTLALYTGMIGSVLLALLIVRGAL